MVAVMMRDEYVCEWPVLLFEKLYNWFGFRWVDDNGNLMIMISNNMDVIVCQHRQRNDLKGRRRRHLCHILEHNRSGFHKPQKESRIRIVTEYF